MHDSCEGAAKPRRCQVEWDRRNLEPGKTKACRNRVGDMVLSHGRRAINDDSKEVCARKIRDLGWTVVCEWSR